MICYVCHEQKETRPYGESGQSICFPCMKGSPEREDTAKKIFGALLTANEVIGNGVTVIGSEDGPTPFELPTGERP